MADFDLFEIGESYPSQAMRLIQKLGADGTKVNPRGGSIAIGNPLGATGCVMMCRALSYLEDVQGNRGLLAPNAEGDMLAAAVIQMCS